MDTEQLLRVLGRMAQPAPSSGMLKLAGACMDDALLHSFRTGGLDENARSAAEQHLHVCEGCTERLLTVGMAVPELQSGNRRRILASAALGARVSQPARAWWMAPQWVGGLVAVGAAVLVVLRPAGETPAVPVYGFELTGQVAAVRGEADPSAETRFSAQSLIVLRGFPAQGVPQAVPTPVLYVGGPSGSLHRVAEPFTHTTDASTGMVEVEILAERLNQGTEGPQRVAMLLTFQPEAAPEALDPQHVSPELGQLMVKGFRYEKGPEQ